MNQYLIPANSKKSRLIAGFFTKRDLIVCGVGVGITIFALLVLHEPPFWALVLAILPLLTSVLLVFPVPHYHNVMQLIINIVQFYNNPRKYYWKGWCVQDERDE